MENKLSKNTLAVYKIFEENPYVTYSVEDIIQVVEDCNYTVGQRSIYRAIERLVNARKIVCTKIKDGCRLYQLSNTGHLDLICKNCGSKTSVKTNGQDKWMEEIYARYHFDILSFSAEYYGTCKCTC